MKRFLSLLLCLVMLVGVLPVNALAAAPAATESSAPTEAPLADSAEESDTLEKSSVHTTEPTEPEVIAVTGITLDQTALEVGVGAESVTLTATVTPEDATDKTVIWTSSEPGVASVEDGVLTFGYMGEAVITATAGDFSANCTVTVGEGEATAYEESDTTYVLAGSDFQADSHTASAANVSNILYKIRKDYPTMDGFLFAGDYDVDDINASNNDSAGGKAKLQETVQSVYGSDMDEIYVQGNHDKDALVGSTLTKSGANDAKDYGVFVINEKDYMWYNNDEGTIKNTASNLESYLNEKLNDKYSKPIFVVSHLPLHYSMRTREGGGDGKYANHIFNVLNKAGEAGLNIIYLCGHDHSHGWDDYLGGAAIFLKKGDKINIAQSSTTVFKEETLQFTYMNAGYVGYYGTSYTSDVDKTLTMTTFAITDTEVTISRYDSNGTHNLKSAGVYNVEYPDSNYYSTNTDVVESSYTLKLNQFEPDRTVEDKTTGITVTAPGITGVTVTQKQNPTYDTEKYSAYASYDITLTGYTQGKTATVTIPTPKGFDTSKPAVVLYGGKQIAKDTDLRDGITFTTTHFSEYDVAQVDESAGVTKSGYLAVYTGTKEVTTLESGKTYIISCVNTGTTLSSTVTNNRLTLNNTVSKDCPNLWTITSTGNGNTYYVQDSSGKYLTIGNDAASVTDAQTEFQLNYITGRSCWELKYGNYYLNQHAGGNSTEAGGWTSNANNDANSRWKLYELVVSNGDSVTLTVTPASKTITTGTTANLTASVLVNDKAATSKTITWRSSDPSVATVDSNGVVTGVADGNATITATLIKANDQGVNGTVSVEIPVTVKTRTAVSIAVDPMSGNVQRGAQGTAKTGSTITVTYDDDSTETVPVTVSMLTKDGTAVSTSTIGTYDGLTVTYEGATVSGYTLNVVAKAGNNYPTYPDEGAVKITKNATGVDFQASGVAQVELGVSGVPVKKGADVIVMLDLSGSMDDKIDGKTRLSVLQASLKNLLIQLQGKGEDGEPMDIRIAVADFNQYYPNSNSPYYINANDHVYGGSIRTETGGTNRVYTGNNQFNAGAFVDVHTLEPTRFDGNALGTHSGTNYDYAFDVIYQLGEAITTQNATNGEERDLFVIFMSDGAPFQYNYFGGSSNDGGSKRWNNWLQGTMTDDMFANGSNKSYYNPDGNKHWMAEAIKGDPTKTYPVIRKNNAADTDGDTWVEVYGLGAKMYSIGFCLAVDQNITVDSMDSVIRKIASDEKYYYRANNGEDLDNAFTSIGYDIAYAAENARLVDQMGKMYDIQLGTVHYAPTGSTEKTATISPTIEVLTYDIYTKAEAEAGNIPAGKNIGDRKGTYTLNEVVMFSEDGKYAYSNLIDADGDGTYGVTVLTDNTGNTVYTISDTGDNILIDDIICANTFWYNTTEADVTIDGVNIPTSSSTTSDSTNVLSGETFYWKVGTVMSQELAIRYYVYLEDSTDGGREAGSYDTNEYATLYYDNYLGNHCSKDAPVPSLAWKGANVSYAFYLVDASSGVPVNNDGTEVPFNQRTVIVSPTPYANINLFHSDEINSMNVAARGVIPEGYWLYDEKATYEVTVRGNGTGKWVITGDSALNNPNSTYVTGYDGENYTNENNESTTIDYTHTTVWFAVKWQPRALDDTVVIDYGLPVDVHVLTNDMFGKYGKLVGITAGVKTQPEDNDGESPINAKTDVQGKFGKANVIAPEIDYTEANSVVRYELDDMQMNGIDQFTYAVQYANPVVSDSNGFYYGCLTVIPATTIYYEDSFVTLKTYTKQDDSYTEASGWSTVGNTVANATQAEDRPGSIKYAYGTVIDSNNVYGYDGAYTACSEYSLGSAAMVNVYTGKYAKATFTFYGTGFDVVSLTDNTTGTIYVDVYDVNNEKVVSESVNTYYGYARSYWKVDYIYRNDEWVVNQETEVDQMGTSGTAPETPEEGSTYTVYETRWATVSPTDPNALYQVPVIKIGDGETTDPLPYGKYRVEITVSYAAFLDSNKTDTGYNFYLDAIRIYNPAGAGKQIVSTTTDANGNTQNTTIADIYAQDREGWPTYFELRDHVITKNTFDSLNNETVTGLVFIDGTTSGPDNTASVSDYTSYGPNNELYLEAGNAVAFKLEAPTKAGYDVDTVQIAVKTVGGTGYVKIYDADANTADTASALTVSTATDMYYDITALNGKNVVILNSGDDDAIISITNIKVTYKVGLATASEDFVPFKLTRSVADAALMSMANVEDVEEPTTPETTVPEETEPETTVPEETEPEATVPEETMPEDSGNNTVASIKTIVEKVMNAVNWVLSWLRH